MSNWKCWRCSNTADAFVDNEWWCDLCYASELLTAELQEAKQACAQPMHLHLAMARMWDTYNKTHG